MVVFQAQPAFCRCSHQCVNVAASLETLGLQNLPWFSFLGQERQVLCSLVLVGPPCVVDV